MRSQSQPTGSRPAAMANNTPVSTERGRESKQAARINQVGRFFVGILSFSLDSHIPIGRGSFREFSQIRPPPVRSARRGSWWLACVRVALGLLAHCMPTTYRHVPRGSLGVCRQTACEQHAAEGIG